jgi:predicted transcriptional regulator
MIKKQNKYLHGRELDVMRIVWDKGEVPDAEVQEELARTENLDSAEVGAIVRDLVQNGVLTGREEDRTYVYAPLVSRREVESAVLQDLVDGMFGGSVRKMLAALVEHHVATRDQLKSISAEI